MAAALPLAVDPQGGAAVHYWGGVNAVYVARIAARSSSSASGPSRMTQRVGVSDFDTVKMMQCPPFAVDTAMALVDDNKIEIPREVFVLVHQRLQRFSKIVGLSVDLIIGSWRNARSSTKRYYLNVIPYLHQSRAYFNSKSKN